MPDEIRAALDRLKALALDRYGRRRRGTLVEKMSAVFSDPLMALALDLRVEEHRELVRSFGPFSIHAELYGENDKDSLVSIHDCGMSSYSQETPISSNGGGVGRAFRGARSRSWTRRPARTRQGPGQGSPAPLHRET